MSEPYEHDPNAPVCPTCAGYGGFYNCPDCLDGKVGSKSIAADHSTMFAKAKRHYDRMWQAFGWN